MSSMENIEMASTETNRNNKIDKEKMLDLIISKTVDIPFIKDLFAETPDDIIKQLDSYNNMLADYEKPLTSAEYSAIIGMLNYYNATKLYKD